LTDLCTAVPLAEGFNVTYKGYNGRGELASIPEKQLAVTVKLGMRLQLLSMQR